MSLQHTLRRRESFGSREAREALNREAIFQLEYSFRQIVFECGKGHSSREGVDRTRRCLCMAQRSSFTQKNKYTHGPGRAFTLTCTLAVALEMSSWFGSCTLHLFSCCIFSHNSYSPHVVCKLLITQWSAFRVIRCRSNCAFLSHDPSC